ncbi:hypothetical protein L484_016394 [Morus notabilis]|uniref:Uncharacterized protein n=1 Tax=Morus notabilis TaxID=981085 RepID=W9RND3_9ROSA|nr:hypothetical protein L484_016394 [Morus notabilis]
MIHQIALATADFQGTGGWSLEKLISVHLQRLLSYVVPVLLSWSLIAGQKIMAGGNFMHRVVSYLVNELLVNSLANSPAFQRFAVRTSKRMEDMSTMAVKKRQELAEQMKDLSKNFEGRASLRLTDGNMWVWGYGGHLVYPPHEEKQSSSLSH